MYEVFKAYLDSKISLTEEQHEYIRSKSVVKKFRKHQYLLQEGDLCNHAFVSKGCLRSYSVDGSGMETIVIFAIENWWIGDLNSLMSGEPAKLNIDAVEDSEVVLISKQDFDLICQQIHPFNDMVKNIWQRALGRSQKRLVENISLTACEKYSNFLETYPGFALRIPQNMIASYLGMSPETLSRARTQLMPK